MKSLLSMKFPSSRYGPTLMKAASVEPGRNLPLALLLLGLLTLLAMYAHRLLPPKVLTLVPAEDTIAFVFMNDTPGAKSQAGWLDEEDLRWFCRVVQGDQAHVCGFHLNIGGGEGSVGQDLSGFDFINVDIDYLGPAHNLRFYLRNYEPGFSDIHQMVTAKFNNVRVPARFVDQTLVLRLKEFSVAEWWIDQFDVPRDMAQPDFRHVTAFGVDLTYPSSVGEHHFHLKKVELVGLRVSAERWYLSILIFWVLVIIALGVFRLAQLTRRIHLEQVRQVQLANRNRELEAQSDEYKHQSLHDHLTGLLNRQGLSEVIEREFDASLARPTALVIMDVDHFKKINDSHGHEGGDQVLRRMGEILRHNTRNADWAGRWGGEEFVVILPGTSAGDAYRFAEKLRLLIESCRMEAFPDLRVTASFGVGADTGDQGFHELFRHVDTALYRAKVSGRNRCVMVDSLALE